MESRRFDGIGIAMLGLAALVVVLAAIAGFFRPEVVTEACTSDCLARFDLSAQSNMAWAAWVMVVVSVAGGAVGAASLFLIAATLREAKRSADAAEVTIAVTRELGMAASRAYLNVDGIQVRDEVNGTLTYSVTVSNSGQSPALLPEFHYGLQGRMGWKNPPQIHWDPEMDVEALVNIPVGGSIQQVFAADLTKDWKSRRAKTIDTIHVFGEIDYLDVFGEKRTQEFSLWHPWPFSGRTNDLLMLAVELDIAKD